MMNLSSLSKAKLYVTAGVVGAGLAFGATFVLPSETHPLLFALSIGAFALSTIMTWVFISRTQKLLATATEVCIQVTKGNFEARMPITGHNKGEARKFADKLNNAIDINDAFVRESDLAMKAASEGRFYRKIRPEGMRGAFLKGVNGINTGIDSMALRDDLTMRAVQETNDLARSAIRGDLRGRIDASQFTGNFKSLVESMNELMDAIEKPIDETNRLLGLLSNSDLTHRITNSFDGTFDQLTTNSNSVAENLAGIMSRLGETSGGLKTATNEILMGSNDLADRTTRQASAIEQTSAAMEQLASTISENAKDANSALERANSARSLAQTGGTVMNNANTAMERITESSSKISDVIGLIDGIAFQTNLLALNASVEAARAGEVGKGFAVVAIEVRRLAQSAASASTEVKALIEASVKEVTEGSSLVTEASQNLDQIVGSVTSMSDLMKSISTKSDEQSLSIDELNAAIRQIDEMTQHNAALVEETNAAIEQTETQAEEVDQIVGTFRTDTQSTRSAAAAKSAPPSAPEQRMSAPATNGNAALKQEWTEF